MVLCPKHIQTGLPREQPWFCSSSYPLCTSIRNGRWNCHKIPSEKITKLWHREKSIWRSRPRLNRATSPRPYRDGDQPGCQARWSGRRHFNPGRHAWKAGTLTTGSPSRNWTYFASNLRWQTREGFHAVESSPAAMTEVFSPFTFTPLDWIIPLVNLTQKTRTSRAKASTAAWCSLRPKVINQSKQEKSFQYADQSSSCPLLRYTQPLSPSLGYRKTLKQFGSFFFETMMPASIQCLIFSEGMTKKL